jgi:hypothetical protein
MIVYQLACDHDHFFEGWFASSVACEKQVAAGQLQCPACGSLEVRKLPSAPYVRGSHGPAAESSAALSADDAKLRRQALAHLRRFLLANTDDVGKRFAEVARRIHYKEEKEHNIRGVVSHDEALELHEEGIEAYAIPGDVLPPSEEIH